MIKLSRISKVLLISLLITTTVGVSAYSISNKKSIAENEKTKVLSENKESSEKDNINIPLTDKKNNEEKKDNLVTVSEEKKDNENQALKATDNKKNNSALVDNNKVEKEVKKEAKKEVKKNKVEDKKLPKDEKKPVDVNNTELSKEEILKKARTALDLWYSSIENFENIEYETIQEKICYTSPRFTSKDQIVDVFKGTFTESEAKKIADDVSLTEDGKLYIIVGQIGDVITYRQPITEFKAIQEGDKIKVSLTEKRGTVHGPELRKQELKLIRENGKWVFTKCWFLFK
ncbi:hypothetical protein [Hathewaya massiliensis]|uniref:hypothetical protein n=1 Tax=Hathewaya massiliensis TaxID=1964382 RepID=UPI00115964F1|nr:hypothetical protein [Hathewaya massiliensis]